ncbi:MAG: glutamate-cysteine ligase family protein [Myxococcales bacterium]
MAPFQQALTPESHWRVGTEAEKFGILSDSHAALPYEGERSVSRVLELLERQFGWFPQREYEAGPVIALERGGASITLEPGGQVELSGAPFVSIHDTAAEWRQHMDELHWVGAELGITWLGLGFHPFASQSDLPWVPKLRYGIMREYLPTRGSGGLDMMRRTCTVQANLDYSSETDAMQKLRLGLALSPIVSALFANSPLVEGRLTGERSHRALVWVHMDPDRSGLLPFAWRNDMSFARYVEWALDVPMFMVKREGKVVRNTGQTFRSFMDEGFGGTQATYNDWVVHLGTLFPEVRLKKTLELRGADSLPSHLLPALPALWKGLLYDAQTRDKLENLVSPITYEAAEASRPEYGRLGLKAKLAGREIAEWATQVISLARDGLNRIARPNGVSQKGPSSSEAEYLEPLARMVQRAESPADVLIAGLDASRDLAPQVMELAKL